MCTGWVLGLTSEQMSKGLSSTPITPDTAAKAKISSLKYVYMEKHIVGVSMWPQRFSHYGSELVYPC